MLIKKHNTLLSAIILFLFGFGFTTVPSVFASGFGDRLSKCSSTLKYPVKENDLKKKKRDKRECYQTLVSDIIERLKKECGSQYKNLTTKVKGSKRTTFSNALDYCSKEKKLECFLNTKTNKIFLKSKFEANYRYNNVNYSYTSSNSNLSKKSGQFQNKI